MTPRHPPRSFVTRALASGLAALYFFTNVAAGHAAESNFWKDRRRAASLQWGEPTTAAPSRGGALYARLPTVPSQGPDLSSLWEQPVHRVSQDLAETTQKNTVRGPDARLVAVAQAVAPFGQVRRVKASPVPGAPLILHVQDVHGNLDAQRNMSGMVLALAQKQSPLVGLEGASGAFEMESFHAYPDLDIVKTVADYFLEKDLIGGPEHAGLVAPKPLTLWGVEDPALYLAHVAAVKESLAGRGRADAFLGHLAAAVEALKNDHYSPALRDFDKNQTLYERDQRGLGEYVENLKGFQKTLSAREFPNVEKLLVAARREKTMDFEAVENERRALVEGLATRLSVPELQDLVRRSLDLKAGTIRQRDYQTHLKDLCARHKLALSRFPRLVGYMDYIADSESIEREALLSELDRLETSAQDALARTPVQRDIVSLARDLSRLSKLIANEMTPGDWSAYEPRRAAMARLGERLKALPGGRAVETPADWEGFVRPYEEFCRKALARNSALADRTLEKMKSERKGTAVLVAGGFHTDGLVDLLAARGATVVVLTPKIGPVDGASNYLDVFARDPLPVEKIFAGEPIALKDRCGLGAGELAGEQAARVHAAVAGRTLMVAWEDLRGLGHNARTILRELRERLLSLSQEVAGLSLLQPRVQAVGSDGLTFSYRAPNGREESVSFRETDDGIVASGRRRSGPGVWWRGATGWVARLFAPRPTSRTPAPEAPVIGEGSFFLVRDHGQGRFSKEVKEIVGPRGGVQYKLSEADRERLAQLAVEFSDRVREPVARASGGRVQIPVFERRGWTLWVDQAPGGPRATEAPGDRGAYLDAMRGADIALGLEGLNDPIYTPDRWRVHVDREFHNFYFDAGNPVVTWIDPVTVWPPADRQILSAGAVETPALARPDPLAPEWAVAWRESFGFLRPVAFFRAHATWTAAERWVGALLIVGLWGVFGETAATIFQWAGQVSNVAGAAPWGALAAGVTVGWAVTVPLHAGWNLLADRVNAVLASRGGAFRLPRLTVHEDMTHEFEAIESNLQTLKNSLTYLEKEKGNPSIRLQVVELYLQTIDRLTRLMADMEKYLPKANVQKFRSRIFASQDWLPPTGQIINLIELIGRDGNFQTAHGFLGQIGRNSEFVSPLDTVRLKETQTVLRQAALQAETQRMKGVRPNGKQVRAIVGTLALSKTQEHWLDVYAALERGGLDVSFDRMAAVGGRSAAEYKRLWDEGLGGFLTDNWAGGVRPLPGDETLLDDLEAALEIHAEEEPTTDGFLKKWPTAEDFSAQIAKTANVPEPLVGLWLKLEKKGEYAKLVKRLTSASPMLIVDRDGVEWRVMSAPRVFEKMKPTQADTVSRLARKLIELGDAGQTRGAEYSQRGILREKWATSWWIFGKKFDAQKTLMIYWFGSGSEAHEPGDSFAANKDVERKVFENADNFDPSNAIVVMSDLTESRVKPAPAGALPRVVEWLKARGNDTGAAIRQAPLIESGLFSVAFLVPFALTVFGVDGASWAVGGVYALMNAYFGLQHTRVYRFQNGQWVEGLSTWKTKAWLMGVGAVVHAPLLLLALNPLTGPVGMLAMYAGAAGASVALHRLYNWAAAKLGLPAATVPEESPNARMERAQNAYRVLIHLTKRLTKNETPEREEETRIIQNVTLSQVYQGLVYFGLRNEVGQRARSALRPEERNVLSSFFLGEMKNLNNALVEKTNELSAIDSQRAYSSAPLVQTTESIRLRDQIGRMHSELLPILQTYALLGDGATLEFRQNLAYQLVGILNHPMVDVNLKESFSRFLADRMMSEDDEFSADVLFDSLVPAEATLPRGREYWRSVFTDAWPQGENPNELLGLLDPADRTQRRLGLAVISFYSRDEERLLSLIGDPQMPTAFRLLALQKVGQRPGGKEATIQILRELMDDKGFQKDVLEFIRKQSDDTRWTADLFENPLFASEDGNAFLTGIAMILRSAIGEKGWDTFRSLSASIGRARFLSYWDNAHAQMSFGGTLFRSYRGGAQYNGRLLAMVAAHEMTHAFLNSLGYGYETPTEKRLHEFLSDNGTNSLIDALRFSSGDLMAYAQTVGFFSSQDGGSDNQHARARQQLLLFNEALNRSIGARHFSPSALVTTGFDLIRRGGANAADPNLTFANLFRTFFGLDTLRAEEMGENPLENGLIATATLEAWFAARPSGPPTVLETPVSPPGGFLARWKQRLFGSTPAPSPAPRLRSEQIGNRWVVSDGQGWRVELPVLPVQSVDGVPFSPDLPAGYLEVTLGNQQVTSFRGVADDVSFEETIEILDKLFKETVAAGVFPRVLGVHVVPGSNVPRLVLESFPVADSFENLGLQRLTPELDHQMETLFSDRLVERFRSGAFNLDQGIYHRHFYLIDGKVRFRLPVETYALKRFFEYFKSKPTVPAGAIPGVVHWLKARGNDTAAAIGKAPWIESGLFATAFLVPALMVVSGVTVPLWAAGGLYALSNVYFGQKHSRVYRFDGLRWVEGSSTWKTRLWLAAVGVVVHLPVLLATLNPLAGPVGFLGLYAGAAAASVGLHRLYNAVAQRSGWPAATILPIGVGQQGKPVPGPVVEAAWVPPVQFRLLTSNQLAKALIAAWESRDLSELKDLALSRGLDLETLNSLLERSEGEPGEITEGQIKRMFGVFKEIDFSKFKIEAQKGRGLGREIDLSIDFLNSLTKEEIALAFRNMFGIRVSAGDISDQVELEYLQVDQAEHKHVFKAHFKLREVPSGQTGLSLAILKEEKSGLGPGLNITDRELEDLVHLRGTGYVPRVGLVGQLDDGARVIIEPFIPGLTLTELQEKGELTNSLRTRVSRVLFSIAHELDGKIPYDSHGGNFIHDSTGDRLVMVDIGEMREEISPGRMTPAKRNGLVRVVRNLFEDYGDITGADVQANEAILAGILEAGRTMGMGILRAVAETPDEELKLIQDPKARKAISITRNYYEKIRSPGLIARGSQVPAAAIPGVVDWLRAQGLNTAEAIRKAPLFESGLFSIAFLAVLAFAMAGMDGGSWAAGGVYGLMNAYFGYKHETVFRYRNGGWVETRATWKTRVGLMGVGLAIHAPLLLSAWSAPFVGGLWFAVLYPFLAATAVGVHRWYNERAKERGWAAATVPGASPAPGAVIGQGSFFVVTDAGNGELRKEVKEYVGPPSRLYRLSEAEREKAAALVVEHTNRIRRAVNEQLRVRNPERLATKNFLPYLRREGRFIFVDTVEGVPFSEAVQTMSEAMAEEARRDIRGAVRAASDVFDLKYDQMLEREDGWRIGVDNRPDNFLFVGDDLTGWIDAISPWPPETHRVSGPGESPPTEGPGAGTGVRVDFDGPMPRVDGWASPLERSALSGVRSQVAALVKGMPPLRSETRNGFQVETMDRRGHPWPSSHRGQDGDAQVFEIQSNGKSYRVKIAFGMGAYALANAAAGAAPATGVPGVRALVDFSVTDAPLRYSYLVTEAPIGQSVGEVLAPATQNPAEARDAVLARIEAIPAEHVRAALETVRALADRGVSVNAALTRYDKRFGFVFEGLMNDADPLHQQALEWFPVRNTPDETAREVVARVLSAVAGVYPSHLNPYYNAAREKVAAAALAPRPGDRRLATILVDNLRRAWREQISALRPDNLFPAGFSLRQAAQSAFFLVGLLSATMDAVGASVGVALGGKMATLAQALSFGTVAGLSAAGWRAVTSPARDSSSVDVIRVDEAVTNPFGWRVDGESLAGDARLGLAEDLGRLLLGGVSRPVWLGFKDLRRSYRSTAADPAPSSRASFRAHLADMARGQGRDPLLFETSLWGVRENEVFRAATLRKGQAWGGITLSRWALAELILATATPFQRAMPWFHRSARWALGVESGFLERGAARSQTDRLTRAARALAVLRAAGFSLSSPNSFLNQEVSQEQDRRLLLNAAGVANADVSLVANAYNAALEKIAATNLWNNAATAAFVRLNGGRAFLREGVPAGGPTGTLYFNIDALVQADAATEEQRGKVAESLEGVLSALLGEYLRDRLVLTTSLSGDAAAAEALIARLTREFGPSFRALRDLTVLTGESAPSLYEEGALRLSVLADHAKGRGTGELEVWTHDAKKVLRDRPGLDKILVVDILDIAVKFDRMLRQMRFLATNA